MCDGEKRLLKWHFSFGIICWQMLTLQRPWRKMSREAMWSSVRNAFGIICWELLSLKRPYEHARVISDIWKAVKGGGRPWFSDSDAAGAPEGFTQLMQELWAHDPKARPTFAEALERLNGMRLLESAMSFKGYQVTANKSPGGSLMRRAANTTAGSATTDSPFHRTWNRGEFMPSTRGSHSRGMSISSGVEPAAQVDEGGGGQQHKKETTMSKTMHVVP